MVDHIWSILNEGYPGLETLFQLLRFSIENLTWVSTSAPTHLTGQILRLRVIDPHDAVSDLPLAVALRVALAMVHSQRVALLTREVVLGLQLNGLAAEDVAEADAEHLQNL